MSEIEFVLAFLAGSGLFMAGVLVSFSVVALSILRISQRRL